MRKNPMRSMIWRRILVILLMLIQVLLIAYYLYSQSQASNIVMALLQVLSICVTFYILGREDKPAYKILWIMIILFLPLFGGTFYLLFNYQTMSSRFRKAHQAADEAFRPLFLEGRRSSCLAAADAYPAYATHIRYLEGCAGFPVWDKTSTEFLPSGECFWERVLEELDKAERYIFVETFIMQEGKMLGAVLDKLEQKAREGIQVRIMYDDIGCFLTLPKHYKKTLTARGFQCTVFNPFNPILSTLQNNRDHRKIISVDGKVAFTGGVNLADEYINAYVKHGHWRDSAICLQGEAAWSLTLIFLQLWSASNRITEEYTAFHPWREAECPVSSDGYVQPYADSPLDHENVGEHVYIQVINAAQEYLYINTPYLIVDNTLMSALKLSAKSGVDVRIITPFIWDKRVVHFTTRSYYRELIRAGIRVYEYSPGFNHSKTFVADDRIATVGTTNLDYRSLYLHFECGVAMYGSSAVQDVKEDFLATLPQCKEITEEDCKCGAIVRLFQELFRIFAPLM